MEPRILPENVLKIGAIAGLLTMKAGGGQEKANIVDDVVDEWLLTTKKRDLQRILRVFPDSEYGNNKLAEQDLKIIKAAIDTRRYVKQYLLKYKSCVE